jgi:hypothetical protein
VRLVLAAVRAKLFQFQALCSSALVFGFAVIPVFALSALELNNFTRHLYSCSLSAVSLQLKAHGPFDGRCARFNKADCRQLSAFIPKSP